MESDLRAKLGNDLPEEVIRQAKSVLRLKINGGSKPSCTYEGANVFTTGGNGSGYVILEKNGEPLYFVRYEKIRDNALKLGRQVLVRREKPAASCAGFASMVFFKILLPKFKVLVADQLQTMSCRVFWQYAFLQAEELGLHSYFLDRRSSTNKLIELKSAEDAAFYEPQMWGTTEGHKRTFAVISSVPLQLKKNS